VVLQHGEKNMHQLLPKTQSVSPSSAREMPSHRGTRHQEGQRGEHQGLEGEMTRRRKSTTLAASNASMYDFGHSSRGPAACRDTCSETRRSIAGDQGLTFGNTMAPPYLTPLAIDAPIVVLCGGGSYTNADDADWVSGWFGVYFFCHVAMPHQKNVYVVSVGLWCIT